MLEFYPIVGSEYVLFQGDIVSDKEGNRFIIPAGKVVPEGMSLVFS